MAISWEDHNYRELQLLKTELSPKYDIVDYMGEGWNNKLFKIKHKILEEEFALETAKYIEESGKGEKNHNAFEKIKENMFANAKKLVKISKPNTARIKDISSANSHPFIIREYIKGKSLTAKIREEKILKNHEILNISKDVLSVLAGMHAKGLAHGALNPTNIIIDEVNGKAVVTEPVFEYISSMKTPEDDKMAGIRPYMAPGQVEGEETPAADIYAYGVILYQMFTGELPFVENPDEHPGGQGQKPVPPVWDHNPEAPLGIQRVINRAMAPNPQGRYEKVEILLNAVIRVLDRKKEDWRVLYDRSTYSIFTMYRRYRQGDVFDRSFYRREKRWSETKKSRLIESILLNLPVPGIYLAEDEDGKKEVVDGQERLSAVFDFLDNTYILQELNVLKELNGKRFETLGTDDMTMQRRIEDYGLTVIIIKKESHPDAAVDTCGRLNESLAAGRLTPGHVVAPPEANRKERNERGKT